MKRVISGAAAVAAVVGMAIVPLSPAAAADPKPSVLVKLRTVAFDAYTGNVTVTARVACTGADTASWNALLVQDVRASGSAPITCDGQRRRSQILLDPADGRFQRGPADLTYGAVACSATDCVGFAASQSVELVYTP